MSNTFTLDRRRFLQARWLKPQKRAASPTPTPKPQPQAPLDAYTGTWTRADVVHLLKRTMFGAKKADIDYFLSLGMSASVDELLNSCAGNNAADLPPEPPDDYTSEAWQGTYPYFNQGELHNYLATGSTSIPAIATLMTQLANLNPPPPVVDFIWDTNSGMGNSAYNDLSVPEGKIWVVSNAAGVFTNGSNTTQNNEGAAYLRIQSYWAWLVKHMINNPRSIREKMTLFWSNFFPVNVSKNYCCTYQISTYWHNANLRHRCLGNYKDLLKSVTISPAMLMMLDGYVNTVNTPNQNYGRELQEIYAIGLPASVNPNESYTEQDVVEVSRILTGWTFFHPGSRPEFVLANHDTGNKQLSAFYGNALITGGNTVANAKTELDQFLNIVYTKPQTALNVCRKLYRFFVSSDIDETIETTIITPLAQILRNNNYEILPVMQTLLKSQHFYSMNIRGGMVKPPVDFLIGLYREFDLYVHKTQGITPAVAMLLDKEVFGDVMPSRHLASENLAQMLDHFPSAFGWRAYYDTPAYDRHWINATNLQARRQFAATYLSNHWNRYTAICMCSTSIDWNIRFDPIPYMQDLTNNVMTADNIIQKLQDYFCVIPLCDDAQQQLAAALNPAGQNSWTITWSNYLANPTNVNLLDSVTTRLRGICILFNQLEETQLI
jgi:hypothetical protein